MASSLTAGALALCIISWICGLLAARAQGESRNSQSFQPKITLPYWLFAVGAPLVFWLLTLPDAPPFGRGHASGNGVLLGGLAAILGVFALLKAVRWDSEASRAAGLAMLLSLGAAATITVPLLWKTARLDALMGVGIGWLAVLFLLSLSFSSPFADKGSGLWRDVLRLSGFGHLS